MVVDKGKLKGKECALIASKQRHNKNTIINTKQYIHHAIKALHTCLSGGVALKMFCTSLRMSTSASSRSHSSSTKCFTYNRVKWEKK